jgi:tripartite-type tricarboxylate transporter receptor subunit TctC
MDMMPDRRTALSMLLALPLATPALSSRVWAQSYPARSIKTILPFAPGGVTDVSARYVAQLMSASIGQNLIIENRSGGGGAIGATAAARSDPDGYTILVASSATHSILPAMQEKLDYDPIKSFAPISGMSNAPYLLVVNADVPVKNAKELADYAKANAGKFNFAAATGTPPHILAFVFKELAGADFPVALYRGGSPAMADLFANQVHAIFQPTTIVIPILDDKRIRVLGIATEQRSSLMPDVPTLAEQGFPQLIANSWNGLCAPAGTPASIVERLNKAALEALNSAELKAKFGSLGITIIAGSPEQFGAFMRAEAVRWDGLVKAAKMPKT